MRKKAVEFAENQNNSGRSIIEILWEGMDALFDQYMEGEDPPIKPSLDKKYWLDGQIGRLDWEYFTDDWLDFGETRGRIQGLAYAIAVHTDPYTQNVDAVKEVAMKRWESRNAG